MMKWLKLIMFFMKAPGWLKGTLVSLLVLVALLGFVLLPVVGLLGIVVFLVFGLLSLIISPVARLTDRFG
jgi:hypothetical protein